MGLQQVYLDPESASSDDVPQVDIIAVHGLNPRSKDDAAHAWDTWRKPAGCNGRLWLRDDLPKHAPRSRIFLYEYDATVVYGKDRSTFVDKANALLEAIRIKRAEAKSGPILLLGHSMGGLLIKQALINAHNNPDYTWIKRATTGLAFFATPHRGADWKLVSLGGVTAKIATGLGFEKGSDVVETLKSGSIFSDILQEHWRHQLLDYNIRSFRGTLDDVVPMESARFGMPGDRERIVDLKANHSAVCKFGSSQVDQDNLEAVISNIEGLYKAALTIGATNPQTASSKMVPGNGAQGCSKKRRDGPGPPRFYIPFNPNKYFVGRDQVISDLTAKLFQQPHASRVALWGLGGIGKTQVVLRVAMQLQESRSDCSIFWTSFLSNASYEQACREIIKEAGIQASKEEDAKEVVQRYLSSKQAGKWLLIVDNADDVDIIFKTAKQKTSLIDYLPRNCEGRILFTTRFRKTAVRLADLDIMELKKLAPTEGMQYLTKSFSKDELGDLATAEILLDKLTHLPLAITQAVRYIYANGCSIEEYLQIFDRTDQDRIESLSSCFDEDDGGQNAIATTWLISFQQICRDDESAAELLRFLAFMEPIAIPRSMLPPLGTEQKMVSAIGTLSGYGFLERREDRSIFDMHRLVHLATGVWIKEEKEQNMLQFQSRAINHLADIFPKDEWEQRDLCRQYLPHALRVLKLPVHGGENNLKYFSLGVSAGHCLKKDGRIREAIEQLERLVSIQKATLTEYHRALIPSLHQLADAYGLNGQAKDAVKARKHVVSIKMVIKGLIPTKEVDVSLLVSQHQLAMAYRKNEQIKDAVELSEHVVACLKKLSGECDQNLVEAQSGLADAYLADNQVDKAIELHRHVVAVTEQTLERGHPVQVTAKHQLAGAYLCKGRVRDAIALQQDVNSQKDIMEKSPRYRCILQQQLAAAYLVDGQIQKAVQLLEHLLASQEVILEESHRDRLACQQQLAVAYLADKQTPRGIKLLEHVVAIQEAILEESHRDRLGSQRQLAVAYLAGEQTHKAIKLLEHVVAIQGRTLERKHPAQLDAQHQLLKAFRRNKQIKEATKLLEDLVEIREHPQRIYLQ